MKVENEKKPMHMKTRNLWLFGVIFSAFLLLQCAQKNEMIYEDKDSIIIRAGEIKFFLQKEGFRYGFRQADGTILAPAHPVSGLQIGKGDDAVMNVVTTKLIKKASEYAEMEVTFSNGLTALISLSCKPHTIKMTVEPHEEGEYQIILRTGPIGPAYGMADHAAYGAGSEDLELKEFIRDPFDPSAQGRHRMVSNFAIFPKQRLAQVNMEPGGKLVKFTSGQNAQGSKKVRNMPGFYYFTGSPKEIYQAFLDARNEEGYRVDKPKYAWFGTGWEAFGALSWNTNYKTVTENIDKYLGYGYPLSWMVVGSGFWPSGAGEFDEHGTPYNAETRSQASKKLQATTSFGMWDKVKYPDPKAFIDYFHRKGLILTIGLRIGFIPGGPFTDEGLQNGYFLKDTHNKPALIKPGFPRVPVYLLDSQNPQAVDWYVGLCEKWLAYGVDGFKEDLFHHPGYLRDDLIDPVNRALMDKGVYIMGRNNYLGSPVDIHRYDDFNYNQAQDRGPINGLAYAFSGFPYVYPDIIGGTGLATGRFGDESKDKLSKYLIRYAQYAAVNPSMAFGYGPWNFGEQTNELCLRAAKLHDRLHPYIYSNAVRAYHTGFPYTLTPLPLAYPDDSNAYGLANTTRRSYQWMIGDALMAFPLYGADYETANTRDVYLPAGTWVDYDTGRKYEGPLTFDSFEIPLEKTPLFVGGTGIVVEEIEDQLKARIYPVNVNTETTFYGKDGETLSIIKIDNPDWNNPKITDTTGKSDVSFSKVRHAYQFDFVEGHNYLIN